jgi:hypothetical protein
VSKIAGHTWQALDYADGLVRVGVQCLPVPPADRNVDSICIVEICKERQPAQ